MNADCQDFIDKKFDTTVIIRLSTRQCSGWWCVDVAAAAGSTCLVVVCCVLMLGLALLCAIYHHLSKYSLGLKEGASSMLFMLSALLPSQPLVGIDLLLLLLFRASIKSVICCEEICSSPFTSYWKQSLGTNKIFCGSKRIPLQRRVFGQITSADLRRTRNAWEVDAFW